MNSLGVVRLERRAAIATITLNRPDRINALSFDLFAFLYDLFQELSEDDRIRAIVLQGSGNRGFCSGADVGDLARHLVGKPPDELMKFTRSAGAVVRMIRQCRQPVVAALHGVVAGAGAALALACDIRLAAADTRIAFLFGNVGLSGADMGATYLLPRIVGVGIASELLLSGDFVSAERALSIGLVNRIVGVETVRVEARQLAERLSQGPAFAMATTKRMLDLEAALDIDRALEAEAHAQALCIQHDDFREACDAWLSKRPAKFRGAP